MGWLGVAIGTPFRWNGHSQFLNWNVPLNSNDPTAFIRAKTAVSAPAMVPEIKLHLATEVAPLWRATQASLDKDNLPPPYWAFAWPGGQALARYILDHPQIVRGRRVMDFASGSGLVALARERAAVLGRKLTLVSVRPPGGAIDACATLSHPCAVKVRGEAVVSLRR